MFLWVFHDLLIKNYKIKHVQGTGTKINYCLITGQTLSANKSDRDQGSANISNLQIFYHFPFFFLSAKSVTSVKIAMDFFLALCMVAVFTAVPKL